jgi:hypothetical protein
MILDNSTQVREGSLVEVAEGPLRVSEDPHNFGIVARMQRVSGIVFADVVTNTGKHRLIVPDMLCVLNQMPESADDQSPPDGT